MQPQFCRRASCVIRAGIGRRAAAALKQLANGQRRAHEIADLIARVALRDRSAFQTFYARTSAKLFGVTLRILRDRSEAEEALQEVYVKIWQRADRYVAGGYSPISWLVAVARNHSLDIIRARKPVSDDIDVALDIADADPTRNRRPSRAASGRASRGASPQLEPDRADAVRGAYLDGYSYEELADALQRAAQHDANLAAPEPAETERLPDA